MNNEKIMLESYRKIAPHGVIDLIYRLADRLKGRSLLHVNSSRLGGGVAEMLQRLIPFLMNSVYLRAGKL